MTKIIIANWKENPKNWKNAEELIFSTFEFLKNKTDFKHKVALAIPSIYLGLALIIIEKENIILNKGFLKKIKQIFTNKKEVELGTQDIFWAEEGAYTGKFGAEMLKSVGASFTIVGHSETRETEQNKKGYTNEEINQKVKNLVKNNLNFTLCVGENKRDLNYDYKAEISEQLKSNLSTLTKEDLKNIIIAYEPVWAIGKEAIRVATNEEISEAIDFIRVYLENHFGYGASEIKVIYGGSVDENNIKEILNIKNVDGILVGRASADKEKWIKLLNNSIL